MEEARTAYEQVHQLDPENLEIINNLAWMYTHVEPYDFDRALELANRAISAKPDHAGFRETRGQIYFRLKQWESAIADLEYALNGLIGHDEENAEIHMSLSKCYTEVGNERLASVHMSRFQSLQAAN